MQPMTASLFDLCVCASHCFDPAGLMVATQNDRPIGFAHAGFGPDESGQRLATDLGVTQQIMVHNKFDEPQRNQLADELLAASEAYLRSRGATVLYGGGIHPLGPFYLGLYGGSELPGVLESDLRLTQLFERSDYQVASEVVVMQRDLLSFRPGFSREIRQLKRDASVSVLPLRIADNWWTACHECGHEGVRFELTNRASETLGRVSFWEIEPLATSWGIRTVGLIDLEIATQHRRKKMATYLLGEAFKELHKQGTSIIEVQTMAENEPAIALYKSLGFAKVDTGRVWRKE